jgi:pseudouridine-5'-phosphate glycosidase
MRAALRIPGGQLVANPVPHSDEVASELLTPHIERALQDAVEQKIGAKAVTPFLLSRIFELTEGRSLEANIALVLNNARLGARIAAELVELSP